MKTIREVLALCVDYLKEHQIASARREAEDLLCDALELKRISLYMNIDQPLIEKELTVCRERLVRRAKGEPLAYIHRQVEFAGCNLYVDPYVLIPRQETEILVEKIAQRLRQFDLKNRVLWDLCCGSGCIGIALKKAFPELKVVLSDISTEAIAVAKKNAERNCVELTFCQGDLLSVFLQKKCHFAVCNPPYISVEEYEGLSCEVKDYEPRQALVAEREGLAFYERLAIEMPHYFESPALLWMEIGYNQAESIKKIFSSWSSLFIDKDYSGHDRFVCASGFFP